MSPKLIYLPKTDKIKNGIAITSTKSDIGGLYMQTRGFNSITHLLTKKDDLLKEIDDLEERFNDAYRELEDRTGLIANSVDLPWLQNSPFLDSFKHLKQRQDEKDDFIGQKESERDYHVCETGSVEEEKIVFLVFPSFRGETNRNG